MLRNKTSSLRNPFLHQASGILLSIMTNKLFNVVAVSVHHAACANTQSRTHSI